jgi:hypothetical protein
MNAGVRTAFTSDVLVASSAARNVLGSAVVVTVDHE